VEKQKFVQNAKKLKVLVASEKEKSPKMVIEVFVKVV
tara:strand:- start:723 stop:833 length:111 start_codon:yes stop_codon:yes gene_type:complete